MTVDVGDDYSAAYNDLSPLRVVHHDGYALPFAINLEAAWGAISFCVD